MPENRRHLCGRKRKITPENEVLILRGIQGADRNSSCSVIDRTVRRLLNRNGYFFLQARKKRLMSQTDKEKRVEFAKKMQANYSPNVWTDTIAVYLDGVSFVYKTNPMDQARAANERGWRKKSEGLTQGCLAKGSKAGTGGKVVKMMVAISHNDVLPKIFTLNHFFTDTMSFKIKRTSEFWKTWTPSKETHLKIQKRAESLWFLPSSEHQNETDLARQLQYHIERP